MSYEISFVHEIESEDPGAHMVGDLMVQTYRCPHGHWHVFLEDERGNGMATPFAFQTRGLAINAALDLTGRMFPDRIVSVADDDDDLPN